MHFNRRSVIEKQRFKRAYKRPNRNKLRTTLPIMGIPTLSLTKDNIRNYVYAV